MCKRKSGQWNAVSDFKRLKIESFQKPKAGQLQGFIAVRLETDLNDFNNKKKKFPGKNFPNKGSADQAILGKENLVSQAFSLRSKNPIFGVKLESSEMNVCNENNNLRPIIVEATSLATDFFPEKSNEFLSNMHFIVKA